MEQAAFKADQTGRAGELQDAMTIWDDFVWKKDPEKDDDDSDNEDPIDREWQLNSSAPQRKRRLMHNKSWSHLRNHLDSVAEMFQSSLRVKKKECACTTTTGTSAHLLTEQN